MSNPPSDLSTEALAGITSHEGSKYLRPVNDAVRGCIIGLVDVYQVLVAFNVTCPARQHAIKKLLCSGIRGKGGEREDLVGALAAVNRAINLHDQASAKATEG